MGKREFRRWTVSLEQSGILMLLSVLFLLGGLLGCFFSKFIVVSDSGALINYLIDYLVLAKDGAIIRNLWNTLWFELRYLLLVALIGMTPVKRIGVPMVLFMRGFFLSFSVCCFFQVFGIRGLFLGVVIFIIPALFWGASLFLMSFQTMAVDLPVHGKVFLLRICICLALLFLCVSVECGINPVLIGIISRIIV